MGKILQPHHYCKKHRTIPTAYLILQMLKKLQHIPFHQLKRNTKNSERNRGRKQRTHNNSREKGLADGQLQKHHHPIWINQFCSTLTTSKAKETLNVWELSAPQRPEVSEVQ